MAQSFDVTIVGAGIVGLSIAWRTRQLGMSVTLIERDSPASGATGVAAGMLAPVTEAAFGEEALLSLNLESARRFPAFLDELSDVTGIGVPARSKGAIYSAFDRDQAEALRRLFEFHRELGLDSVWLSADEASSMEPALHHSIRGAFHAPGDSEVDPRWLASVIVKALEIRGVEIKTQEVKRVEGSSVRLADGTRIDSGRLVVAAGSWTSDLAGLPAWLAKSIRGVKGQILRMTAAGEPVPIKGLVRTEDVYLVPRRDGELIVGATTEEKGRDTTVTAGAMFDLLEAGTRAVPAIREMAVTEMSAGLRPTARDNLPVIGPLEDGPILATGHYRNGILLAPVTADAVALMCAKDEIPSEVKDFSPMRFQP